MQAPQLEHADPAKTFRHLSLRSPGRAAFSKVPKKFSRVCLPA